MKNRNKWQVLLLIWGLCLICTLGVGAAGAEVVPLDEDGDYYYYLGIDGTELSVPVLLRMELQSDFTGSNAKILLMDDPLTPEVSYGVFAIRTYEDRALSALTEAEITSLLAQISDEPENLTYTLESDFYNGTDALLVRETRSYDGEAPVTSLHLLAIESPWLINVMVMPFGEGLTEPTQAHIDFIREFLLRTLAYRDQHITYTNATIGDTRMVISLPDEMPMTIQEQGEDGFLGYIAQPHRPELMLFILNAWKDSTFDGLSNLTDLDDDGIQALAARVSLQGSADIWLNDIMCGGNGMMLLQDDVGTYLVSQRDGWGISLTLLHALDVDMDMAFDLQSRLIENIVAGELTPIEVTELPSK